MRDWTPFDTLFVGLLILVFRRELAALAVLAWKLCHERSLRRLDIYLRRYIK